MPKNPQLQELRTLTITGKGQVAIPKELRKLAGFREGQKLALLAYDDRLELRPVDLLRKRLDFSGPGTATALMSERALARTWSTPEEDEAWKDL